MPNAFERLKSDFGESLLDPRTDASRKWFIDKVQQVTYTPNRSSVMRKPPMREQNRVLPGMMYMFYYHPKHEQTLPYYDSFPLIILLNTDSKGMEGLNLHYLPLNLRQKLFYGLLNRVDSLDVDEDSYLRITYEYLKGARSLKEYKPCYKRYLTEQIKGSIANVPAPEWEIALHLPLASFKKKDEYMVHKESERIIENY
jgi:hypothetical protein